MNPAKKSLQSATLPRSRASVSRVGLRDITNQEFKEQMVSRLGLEIKPADLAKTHVRASARIAARSAPPSRALVEARLDESAPSTATPTKKKRLKTEAKADASGGFWLGDGDSVQLASEYAPDVFALFRRSEVQSRPMRTNYFETMQPDLNHKMRAVLVDWLIEVHMKYRLRSETLYLTISIIDRYLCQQRISRNRLQLVGVTALLIAAKYEEIHPPDVSDFVYITDNTYTKNELVDMEIRILSQLNFMVATPTAAQLKEPLLSLKDVVKDETQKEFVNYLIELALVQHHMLQFSPLRIVCAAILLSNELTGQMLWPSILQHRSDLTEDQLRPCAKELHALLEQAPTEKLQAVSKKYRDSVQRVTDGWQRRVNC